MDIDRWGAGRREFLAAAMAATGAAAWAEELKPTPAQTEGPFYPDKLPLDTDNDLLLVNDDTAQALGEVTHLGGRILDAAGKPVRNALVEIWQVDHRGVYLHRDGGPRDKRDSRFQGFGRFVTGPTGEYYFRTVKPVPYPGRTPHIHVMVRKGGRKLLTTQCYVKGDKRNDRDGVLRSVGDPAKQALLMADFLPLPGSTTGELTAKFDIVLGRTPSDGAI